MNENLANAHAVITIRYNLVKQNVNIAEDAGMGWEKAEA
uniref:Uncharacterized protein n=1 Tax=Physcomitrium patens TaxID=3218 RepID=A0A2K1K346_PHYPA|nr:hypothetical protein PHYPA_012671 [Physcomitrium patens]